tara:strand:- start:51 stop:563 length:513 start_codon:yes stop_codon:yes gene_type:complete
MGNVSSISDLLPKQGQNQEQTDSPQSRQHEEITHEGWQYGLRRLRALHPGAEWPAFDDSAGWAALIKEWKLALEKMSQEEWLKAVDYYERSSQIKYPPSPASIWVVIKEVEQIDQRERDGGAMARANKKSAVDSERYASWAKERTSAEGAAAFMAEIRAKNPRMFKGVPR